MVKGSNFTVECNWIGMISQDVPNLVSSWKSKLVSRMKTLRILKTANGSKFAVECNWINKSSRNFLNLGFLMEKYGGFFEKRKVIFTKSRWT